MLDGDNEEHRDVAPEPEVPSAVALEPARALLVDGEDHPVDSNAVVVDRIVHLGTMLGIALITFAGGLLAWFFGDIPAWITGLLFGGWLVIFAGLAFLGYTWPALHHKHLRYRVDEAGVRITRGVLWRKIISIPNSRVQHTDVSQGPLQRRYDIATLTVHTAGTEGASISLGGLRHDIALRLRDHLLPTGGHYDA